MRAPHWKTPDAETPTLLQELEQPALYRSDLHSLARGPAPTCDTAALRCNRWPGVIGQCSRACWERCCVTKRVSTVKEWFVAAATAAATCTVAAVAVALKAELQPETHHHTLENTVCASTSDSTDDA